jgi:hypothetical protein
MSLQDFKDSLARDVYGITAQEAWAKGICISCKQPAAPKCHTPEGCGEYLITANCEECWDTMFADEGGGTLGPRRL